MTTHQTGRQTVTVFTYLREDVDVRYANTEHPSYTLAVKIRCRIPRCDYTYSLGFKPEGQLGRDRHGGPLVDYLFGWLSPEASVIAAHAIEDNRPVIHVEVGDVIVVEGYGTFEVGMPTRNNYDRPVLFSTPWPVTE